MPSLSSEVRNKDTMKVRVPMVDAFREQDFICGAIIFITTNVYLVWFSLLGVVGTNQRKDRMLSSGKQWYREVDRGPGTPTIWLVHYIILLISNSLVLTDKTF